MNELVFSYFWDFLSEYDGETTYKNGWAQALPLILKNKKNKEAPFKILVKVIVKILLLILQDRKRFRLNFGKIKGPILN